MYEGGPICGGPQQVGGTWVHMLRVCLCVFPVCRGGGSVHLGRRDAVRLCLLSPCCVSVYLCVCVFQDFRTPVLPQASPPRGPGPCPRVPWSRGVQSFSQNPSPQATN